LSGLGGERRRKKGKGSTTTAWRREGRVREKEGEAADLSLVY